jgi:dUTP pyrophosphatase
MSESEHLSPILNNFVQILSTPLMDENNHWADFLLVERSDPEAFVPQRSTAESIGFDLRAFNDFDVPSGELVVHNIKVKLTVPKGCYGRIAPKSGLALIYHLDVFGGVVDRDYMDEVKVMLKNHGKNNISFKRGEKIAQLILEVAKITEVKEVKNIKELYAGKSNRTGGFGSTGKN